LTAYFGAALPQSDFFALGRTFVHLLTGKHPQELAKNINTGEIIWRDRAPQVFSSFADLLDSMMHHLPGKRPVNTKAIINALTEIEKFPHKSTKKRRFSRPILLGLIFIPLSVFGLFRLGNNLRQPIADNKNREEPLCQNLTCINRDPIDNKCDRDSVTITSDTGNYQVNANLLKAYRLEMRFSPSCQAAWARTEAPPGSTHYIEDSQGKKYGAAIVPVDQWEEHYADMAPGKDIEIRACAEPPGGEKKCTNSVRL
jgi:serine/threonine protein kinase